jgi:hypothetical protein
MPLHFISQTFFYYLNLHLFSLDFPHFSIVSNTIFKGKLSLHIYFDRSLSGLAPFSPFRCPPSYLSHSIPLTILFPLGWAASSNALTRVLLTNRFVIFGTSMGLSLMPHHPAPAVGHAAVEMANNFP